MFAQDAFDHDTHLGAGAFAQCPIDCRAFADLGDEFCGNDFEIVFPHDFLGALVLS